MKPRRYPKPLATSKRAIHATEAYYRMMADENRAVIHPPMGLDALRKAAAGKPVHEEAEAERIALQQEDG